MKKYKLKIIKEVKTSSKKVFKKIESFSPTLLDHIIRSWPAKTQCFSFGIQLA